jgi:hypothetical protein
MNFRCRRDRCFTPNKRRRSRQHIDPNVVFWTGGAPNSAETGFWEIKGRGPQEDFSVLTGSVPI